MAPISAITSASRTRCAAVLGNLNITSACLLVFLLLLPSRCRAPPACRKPLVFTRLPVRPPHDTALDPWRPSFESVCVGPGHPGPQQALGPPPQASGSQRLC